jgi:pyruvate dehydrogenase E2 component (dihydrolipoamide acetyltransferase)
VAPAAKAAAASSGSASTASSSGGSVAVLDAPASNGTSHSNHGGRIFASPLAKKIAAESNVDLGSLQGSGPAGRIIRKDVEAAISSGAISAAGRVASSAGSARDLATRVEQPAKPARNLPAVLPSVGATLTPRTIQLSNMRKTIAKRLVESKTTIPHYQVSVEVDMDALVALRTQLNEQLGTQGVKLSVNDFLVRACALAMHQHPYVNAKWVGTPGNETIEFLGEVNIGVAIALPVAEDGSGGGLVVATLRNADVLGLRQISGETKRLADKARNKGLSLEDMSDSTFTISNLGMFGVDNFTAIINPPNVAILAAGGALQKPVVRNNQIVPGHVMNMTMSSDHRVIDGAMAAQYLATVKGLLEKPATLLV